MKTNFKKLWNAVTTVILAAVVILALLLGGARFVGLKVYTVLSGSMEPTYRVGSLIYVKEVEPYELHSGDVITFMLDQDTVATHRIVEVLPDEKDAAAVCFRTKGDANEIEDGPSVKASQVIGTPVFTIPYLGYFANYLQTTSGRYATIAVGAVLLLMIFLPDMIFGSEKEKKAKEKSE